MKKLLLTTTFLAAGVIGLFAQGKVAFDNQPYNFPDSIENGGTVEYKISLRELPTDPFAPIADSTYSAQLWQGGVAIGTPIPFYGATFPGVWDVARDTAAGDRTLSTAAGAATTLEVAILNGAGTVVGRSAPFSYTPPTSPTAPPDAFFMSNFRGFGITIVPEPSTVALGVLGLGALLLFRRRK